MVVIDDSKELKNAIHFAAQRAKNTNGALSMLYVVNHAINAQWSKVEHLIEQEETSEAKKFAENGHNLLKINLILILKLLLN